MSKFTPTPHTTPRRIERASFDREHVYAVIDEAAIAHVGFVHDGAPFVIPMAIGRSEARLFLHGSVATRFFRSVGDGAMVCVTITHLDGLVLAKSQFHHSMNYRSVVILGETRRLRDAEALAALERIVDHALPGRTSEARAISPSELRQTYVCEIPLDRASLKMRTGPPIDDEEDLDLPVWSGVIPLVTTAAGAVTEGDGPMPNAFSRYGLDSTS